VKARVKEHDSKIKKKQRGLVMTESGGWGHTSEKQQNYFCFLFFDRDGNENEQSKHRTGIVDYSKTIEK
jgi:hypothetical protein